LTCPNCDAELEIIETEPVEVDWYYEESDDDEQEDW
jgi:Zn-finger nucleic acid-binding protein